VRVVHGAIAGGVETIFCDTPSRFDTERRDGVRAASGVVMEAIEDGLEYSSG